MLRCGRDWQPSEVIRFIEGFPTSTRVMHVVTDKGNAFLKAMGNPGGTQSLACELVGSELASWFGLPTFDFALVDIPNDIELPFVDHVGNASPGPAFITRGEEQATDWDGSDILLSKINNVKDISKLVLFDTWIMNSDRTPPKESYIPTNRDNYLFLRKPRAKYSLLATDHTHCFTDGDLWDDVKNQELIIEDSIYGFPVEFTPYIKRAYILEAVMHLRQLDRATVKEILNAVPAEWGITSSSRDAWEDLIYERAQFVAQNAPSLILDQAELAV